MALERTSALRKNSARRSSPSLGPAVLEERRLVEDGHPEASANAVSEPTAVRRPPTPTSDPDEVSVSEHHHTLVGADQVDGPGQHAIEHDPEFTGVGADQLQDLARCGLERECFSEFGVASGDAVCHLGAGDRIAGLGSEGLEHCDVLLVERIDDSLEHGKTCCRAAGGYRDVGGRSDLVLMRGPTAGGLFGIGGRLLIVEDDGATTLEHLVQRRRLIAGEVEDRGVRSGPSTYRRTASPA